MNHLWLHIKQHSLHMVWGPVSRALLLVAQGPSLHSYSRTALRCDLGGIHWVVQCQAEPPIPCSWIQPKEQGPLNQLPHYAKTPSAAVSPLPCSLTYLCCSPLFSAGKYFLVIHRFYCIILRFWEIILIWVSIRCVTIFKISSYYI